MTRLNAMTRSDRLALVLSLLAVLAAWLVAERVFERMAHLEDEIAYVWQAQAMAGGHLTLPSPPVAKSFLVPFVVDYQGQRFGKYPPGWPAMLAIGVFLGARALVNPLLAGLGVWLTYRLGTKLFGSVVGLLAALLTLVSPFFLLNSGSLLSHPFGLVLSAAFATAWLDAWEDDTRERWLPVLVAALSLGLLVLTRPLTAVAVALPFGVHGAYLFWRKPWAIRKRMLVFVLITGLVSALLFAWQFATTGDALLNPYTLWWEYDKVGFGPGVGRLESGHTLNQARVNTRYSLWVGWNDLFGWGEYSWIFLPFGLLAVLRQCLRRNTHCGRAIMVGSVYPLLVTAYLAYWIGSWLFGPRYYYEGIFSLTIFSAAGIAYLAGWPTRVGEAWQQFSGWRKARPLGMTALLTLLLCATVLFYLPIRLSGMHGLYGVSRARLQLLTTAQEQSIAPALVIVYAKKWTQYGTLLEGQSVFLDTPYLIVIDRGPTANAAVAAAFPERHVYHYYPDDPYKLYEAAR